MHCPMMVFSGLKLRATEACDTNALHEGFADVIDKQGLFECYANTAACITC